MIFRFISKDKSEALAFDTNLRVYTMDYDFVLRKECIKVSRRVLHDILEELYYDGWDYSKNLEFVEKEEVPF